MNLLPSDSPLSERIDRRRAVQWMMAAAAASTTAFGKEKVGPSPAREYVPVAKGYGPDPVLNKTYKPGDFWPLTFTDSQRATAAAICDTLFPADETAPSASSLHVHDFVDEWISSPYEKQKPDRQPILDCIAWFDAESQKRFSAPFTAITQDQRNFICDDVAFDPKSAEFKKPTADFRRFKYVAAGGYFTTPAGWKDIGFVGNTPTINFEGPTPEALKHVGLA